MLTAEGAGVEAHRIGVVGAGVMGSEIAQVAAAAGLHVTLRDVDAAAIGRGLDHVRDIGERRVARGRLAPEEADAILARISAAEDDAALADCDVIIEATTEVMQVKRDVFARLDAVARDDAILASNTSGLSITQMGRSTGRPERVLGLHFFNPASVMRLVEVIPGADTSDEATRTAMDLVARIGKTPVRVAECPGFLVNRIVIRALAEAYRRASETGADRIAADAAVVEEGPAPMGPFALGDLIGLDTLLHVQRDLEEAYGERFAAGPELAALVAEGRLGAKTGAGFLDGSPPGGSADAAGREIAERYYRGAVDEAARCVAEGVASPDDTDLAVTLGGGWEQGPLAWGRGRAR
jgi:3-hydroxybutyryl-CoA dehydrogenase